MLLRFINALPAHFQWTIHNLISHPLSEILHLVGFTDLGNAVHDATIPTHEPGTGRG
jgi:hypothetical protein